MTFLSKFSVAVVFAGAAVLVSAQTAKNQSAQTRNQAKTIIVTLPQSASCPVGMEAQHSPGLTAEVPVGKNGDILNGEIGEHRGPGQQLHLRLSNSKPAAVSAVRITVHGWSAKGRALPTQNSNQADASKTLDVKVNIGPGQMAAADVWVDGLTTVASIDLVGVSYADGSSWTATATQACRIVPDPEMLISNK